MVANSYRPAEPQPAGRLIEASLALWLKTWRACLGEALLYGLASLLPALTVSGLGQKFAQAALGLGFDQWLPWLPRAAVFDPADLIDEVGAWLAAPRTWCLVGLAALLTLGALSVMIHRQHAIATGRSSGWHEDTAAALRRLPAGIGAWLIYLAILFGLTLPLVALTVVVFQAVLGVVDLLGLLGWLALFLVGGVVLSIPLAWASVAYGFAPFAVAAEPVGALAAQGRSRRRVRGHWVSAALVLSVPMLMYLGVGSVLSSLTMLLAGGVAFASGGWAALFAGEWLSWSQLLALVPMAAGLPLATAGGVVAWNDLTRRARTD